MAEVFLGEFTCTCLAPAQDSILRTGFFAPKLLCLQYLRILGLRGGRTSALWGRSIHVNSLALRCTYIRHVTTPAILEFTKSKGGGKDGGICFSAGAISLTGGTCQTLSSPRVIGPAVSRRGGARARSKRGRERWRSLSAADRNIPKAGLTSR